MGPEFNTEVCRRFPVALWCFFARCDEALCAISLQYFAGFGRDDEGGHQLVCWVILAAWICWERRGREVAVFESLNVAPFPSDIPCQ